MYHIFRDTTHLKIEFYPGEVDASQSHLKITVKARPPLSSHELILYPANPRVADHLHNIFLATQKEQTPNELP